ARDVSISKQFFGLKTTKTYDTWMESYGLYLGATYMLAAEAFQQGYRKNIHFFDVFKWKEYAKQLTYTGYVASSQTKTGLPPRMFRIEGADLAKNSTTQNKGYELK